MSRTRAPRRRLRGAGLRRALDRAAPRLGRRRASRCRRCCTTAPSRSPPPSPTRSALATIVVAVAYGDCGTYGALDEVLADTGVQRLAGEHCYDVLGRDEVEQALAEEPGTYFLTDFLARTFEHTVVRELGLDR